MSAEGRTYVGRFRHNCQYCGRFVQADDVHAVYDDYAGGWDIDPYCGAGRGCRANREARP